MTKPSQIVKAEEIINILLSYECNFTPEPNDQVEQSYKDMLSAAKKFSQKCEWGSFDNIILTPRSWSPNDHDYFFQTLPEIILNPVRGESLLIEQMFKPVKGGYPNHIRMIKSCFNAMGIEIPNSYNKIMYGEMRRSYVSKSIMKISPNYRHENIQTADKCKKIVADIVARDWPALMGDRDHPISENVVCAAVWRSEKGRAMHVVDTRGKPYSVFISSQEASSNLKALRIFEDDLIRVRSGSQSTLTPAKIHLMDIYLWSHLKPQTLDRNVRIRLRNLEGPELQNEYYKAVVREIRHEAMTQRIPSIYVADEMGYLREQYDSMISLLETQLIQASSTLCNAMDPECRSILHESFGIQDMRTLSWMTGIPDGVPCASSEVNQQDAQAAFMVTGPLFSLARKPEFRHAVSTRSSLTPVIRDLTGLTKAQINVLAAKKTPNSNQRITSFPPYDPETLRHMDLNELIKSNAAFEIISSGCPDVSPNKLAAEAVKVLDSTSPHREIRDFQDAISILDDKLIMSMTLEINGAHDEVTENFLKSILYPKTVKQLEALSDAYHDLDERGAFREGSFRSTKYLEAPWEPLTKP